MKFVLLLLVSLLLSPTAFAFPTAPVDSLDFSPENFVEEVDYDFNGIVKLSNCSAAVVRFSGQPDASKAYVLTNGHCINTGFFGGFLEPGEVRYNESSNRSMDAFINVTNTVRVRAESLVYATMTDTDAALYRLKQTYQELSDQGVEALAMAAEIAPLGQEIHIVSGYWKRGFECSIEDFVYELREGDWTMKNSIRYSPTGCEVYGGTSGSPVIAKDERVVVGVNNTGNESGQTCTTNNPCEVDEQGNVTVLEGRGYAQQTYNFYTCLTVDFEIDLSKAGCALPKPQ